MLRMNAATNLQEKLSLHDFYAGSKEWSSYLEADTTPIKLNPYLGWVTA